MPILCGATVITLGTLRVALNATKTESVRMLSVQYGDGYKARNVDGINARLISWQVETPPLLPDVADAFEDELVALGPQAFGWCPPYANQTNSYRLDPVVWQKSFEDGLVRFAFTLVPEPLPAITDWP